MHACRGGARVRAHACRATNPTLYGGWVGRARRESNPQHFETNRNIFRFEPGGWVGVDPYARRRKNNIKKRTPSTELTLTMRGE